MNEILTADLPTILCNVLIGMVSDIARPGEGYLNGALPSPMFLYVSPDDQSRTGKSFTESRIRVRRAIDEQLPSRMQSAAWKTINQYLDRFPEYVDTQDASSSGCQVCELEKREGSWLISLRGPQYDRDTYRPLRKPDMRFAPRMFTSGPSCHIRSLMYHELKRASVLPHFLVLRMTAATHRL
jgi:hypothetical protein